MEAFRVLERPQFAVLQRAVFPWYFGIQAAGPALLALTYPGNGGGGFAAARGLRGVLQPANRWAVLAPLAVGCAAGLVNLLYLLPATNEVTALRRSQGTFVTPFPCPFLLHLSFLLSASAVPGLDIT